MDRHLAECPLELVTCEFADAGCSVKLERRELKHHMMEKQQEHLVSATLMNLKLTKESIAEKDHQLADKDRQLVEKDLQLSEKDRQILELQAQLKVYQQTFMESTKVALDRFLGLEPHDFVMERVAHFREHKGRIWTSKMFLSHIGGWQLYLSAQCVMESHKQPFMRVYLSSIPLQDTATFSVTLQVINQIENDSHYTKQFKLVITLKSLSTYTRLAKSDTYDYITFNELFRRHIGVQYVNNDSIKFRMWLNLMIDN